MDSRRLVRRTLEFDHPPSIPRQIWVLPWAEAAHPAMVARLRHEFPDDIVTCPALYRHPLPVVGDRYTRGLYVDEWGCRWDNIHGGVIGIVREPLIAAWPDLDKLRLPLETLDLDVGAINSFCRSSGRFVLQGSWVRPFERLCFLRTMEQALADLVTEPPEFVALLGRIHGVYLREVEAWARTDIDAIGVMDDWGMQHRMLVAPNLWRRLFKPLYRDYAEVARRYGKFLFMHSDGDIMDILPDLIEIGVDALNAQVKCMGVAELGRRFRGQITFWGEIDRQELLPFGSQDQVRAAVRDMRDRLWDGGGIIAQCEFGPGANPENVYTVFETWREIAEEMADETRTES